MLGLPTRVGAPVGTLNLYCERPRRWDESEIGALEAYNDLLEARLGGALLARQHGHIVDQLQFALDSRVAIERAIGLLMGRDGIDGPAAFNELRRAARNSRRRVSEVAEEVLAAHPHEATARGYGLGRLHLGGLGPVATATGRVGTSVADILLDDRRAARMLLHERLDEREREQQAVHEGEDRERRRPALESAVREDVVDEIGQQDRRARALRADRERKQRPRTNAQTKSGTLTRTPGPPDTSELVEEPRDQPGGRDSAARFQRPPPSAEPVSVTSSSRAAAQARPTSVVRARIIGRAQGASAGRGSARPARAVRARAEEAPGHPARESDRAAVRRRRGGRWRARHQCLSKRTGSKWCPSPGT